MRLIILGNYYCEFCKKDLEAKVYAQDLELVMKYKDQGIAWAKNYHWYDYHYNCAICGEWISSEERKLVIEREFTLPINPKYNIDYRDGLLRVHEKCIVNLNIKND